MIKVKTILLPVDYHDYSPHTLAYGKEYARHFNAQIVLVYAVEPFRMRVSMEQIENTRESRAENAVSAGEVALFRLQTLAENEFPGFPVITDVRVGHPHEVIVHSAREHIADIIIMATHGLTGLEHVLIGSVSEKVISRAPCPVMVIREPVDPGDLKFRKDM